MKITIINQHTNNFGDEAAGISLVNTLLSRYPDAKIHIIYNGDGTINVVNPNVIHETNCKLKYMKFINILIKLLFHSYKGNNTIRYFDELITTSDYVFVAPCGANIGIYKDWRFLIRLILVIFNKKKPIFYLNTIGESDDKIFNFLALYVLKNSKLYVREKRSQEFLKSKNLESELGIDTAFLLDNSKLNKKIDPKRITLVVSDISKHKNFEKIDTSVLINNDILPSLCKFAKKNSMKIHVLPHLNTTEESVFIDSLIKTLKREIGFTNIVKEQIETMYDYYNNISNSYLVVGMRYHAVVLAAKACIPFVSLAYENKMCEVSSYTEMSDYCIKLYDDFDVKNYEKILANALKNHDKISKKLMSTNVKIKKLAELPLKEIKYEK